MSPQFSIGFTVWYVCLLHGTFLSANIRITQGMMNHWKIHMMDGVILNKETLGHMGHCVEYIRHVRFCSRLATQGSLTSSSRQFFALGTQLWRSLPTTPNLCM